jgi:hypothetical protein
MLSARRLTRACAAIAVLVAAWTYAVALGRCQDRPRNVNPRSHGIDLPAGALTTGENRAVTTHNKSGQPIVGRLHVRVGEGAVVLLPDGQLVPRQAGQFMPTDRKFEPIDKDDLLKALAVEFPGFKTRATNHYVYVYDASDDFALATGRILESMLPGVKGYAEQVRVDSHNPELPLVVVMFRTEAAFQKHRRMPDGVVAYYDILSNRVVMYEQSRLAEMRPDLALQQSISTIAHEGAHQILHNIGVQQRLSVWPMWLGEGLAEYLAPTNTAAKLRWKGAGQVNDMRMFELEQYLNSNAGEEPDADLVEHTVLAAQLTSTGYASAWALTHYLAKNRRSEFNELLREASRLGPFEGATEVVAPGVIRANRDQFTRLFGEDMKEHQRRMIAHLKKQPYVDPFQGAPHFAATVLTSEGRRLQRSAGTFHTRQLAAKWLRESVEKLPAEQRKDAQTNLRIFPNRAAAETFAKQWLQGKQ